MSTETAVQSNGLNADFWELLGRLEHQHALTLCEYECVRRQLDRTDPERLPEFRAAWIRYSEAIARLDRAIGELDLLQPGL